MHCQGCTCPGGCTCPVGVPARGGGGLCTCPGGVPARGVPAQGVCTCPRGVPAQVLPPVNRMTHRCKKIPFANFALRAVKIGCMEFNVSVCMVLLRQQHYNCHHSEWILRCKIIAIDFAPYERGFSVDFLGSHKILLSAMTCLVSGYTTVFIRLNVIRSLS